MADANKLRGKAGEYRAAVEKAIALPGLSGEQIQSGRFAVAISYLNSNDLKNGLEQLEKAHDAAPDTPRGKMIQGYIARIKQQLDADKPKK